MIEDITETKNADYRRIESENRLSFLLVNLQTGVVLEDENRKILLANKNSVVCLILMRIRRL
jgi:PAS domain-containing protein